MATPRLAAGATSAIGDHVTRRRTLGTSTRPSAAGLFDGITSVTDFMISIRDDTQVGSKTRVKTHCLTGGLAVVDKSLTRC